MNLLEAIGLALLIFAACSGIAAWLFLAWHGAQRLRERLEVGRDLEFMRRSEPDWDKDVHFARSGK